MPDFINDLIRDYIPLRIEWSDIIEILIIAFLVYKIMIWIKNTKAWVLFKGIAVIGVFVVMASILNLTTILWLAEKAFNVGIIAVIIVFQPELRRALEQIGRKNFFSDIFTSDDEKYKKGRFTERTINELIRATFELAKTKTGALIVIERNLSLAEFERTGIEIDAIVTSQVLINIFEHNTPLHDGAIIIRGNRITSATCYLPLSDNMELSKDLGTRHRAGVGISEVTDAITIIVSEETGKVSITENGIIIRNIDGDILRGHLEVLLEKQEETRRFKKWRGKLK